MRQKLWGILLFAIGACSAEPEPSAQPAAKSAPALESNGSDREKLWVSTERVDRRTCPSLSCGSVGWIALRQGVDPLEKKDGWVRITRPYDASCRNGVSEYVDKGEASCTAKNGIVDGRFAEWVPESALASTRPPDPAEKATADEGLVAQSDDFARYHAVFARVAHRLIAERRCTAGDFEEQGGWMQSVNDYPDEPVYFTYCGGMTIANKIYMNAETGEVL